VGTIFNDKRREEAKEAFLENEQSPKSHMQINSYLSKDFYSLLFSLF
jgi:hypothetical protein